MTLRRGLAARAPSAGASEDAIRYGKASGLRNLPFRAYTMNAAWLELVLIGCDLLSWTGLLLLTGTQLAAYEPKRLRYRPLHVAGRLTDARAFEDWPQHALRRAADLPQTPSGAARPRPHPRRWLQAVVSV